MAHFLVAGAAAGQLREYLVVGRNQIVGDIQRRLK
jgi:hypothetical protein